MMSNVVEKTAFELARFEASMQLEKQIIVANHEEHTPGHCVDYLEIARPYVTLSAAKECSLLLWNNHSLLEYCVENLPLELNFKWSYGKNEGILWEELESWCSRNRLILCKSKDEAQITAYFTLLDSHRITGELIIAPILYFAQHPVFTLHGYELLSSLLKTEPIVVPLKKNQLICFDKYHYQMAYNPDLHFIRVTHAHRSH